MAMTGFIVAHQCQPSSAAALIALQADFPIISNGLYITASGATFTAPSTFNVTLKTTGINSSVTSLGNKIFSLPMCDPSIPIDANLTPFDPAVAATFFTIALVFTVGIWMVAKQGGEILSVVKWW